MLKLHWNNGKGKRPWEFYRIRQRWEIAVRSLIFWNLPIYRGKDTNHVSWQKNHFTRQIPFISNSEDYVLFYIVTWCIKKSAITIHSKFGDWIKKRKIDHYQLITYESMEIRATMDTIKEAEGGCLGEGIGKLGFLGKIKFIWPSQCGLLWWWKYGRL